MMPFLILATQLPPPTPVTTLSASAQILLKLIEQGPQILLALGMLVSAVVGLYNAVKIKQVKDQGDGHFSELTKALANSVPASAIPVAPTIVLAPPVANGPSVAGGRRADDAPPSEKDSPP